MCAALAPIPPEALRDILLEFGFAVVRQDQYNWVLEKAAEPTIEPIILPKIGTLVAVDVMMDTLVNARLSYGTYFSLKEKVLGKNWTPSVALLNSETQSQKLN